MNIIDTPVWAAGPFPTDSVENGGAEARKIREKFLQGWEVRRVVRSEK
jgi:hypothetical protein